MIFTIVFLLVLLLVVLLFALRPVEFIKKPATDKTVWTYWHSPEKPPIVDKCILNWSVVGGCTDIRCLDAHSVYNWIPEEKVAYFKTLTKNEANNSDLIRLYLLKEYGGIWMDASVFLTRDLYSWMTADVFCFKADRFSKNGVVCLENFLIKAPQGHPFIEKWYDQCLEDFSDPNFDTNNEKYKKIIGKNADYLVPYISSMKINKQGVVTESAEIGPYKDTIKYKWNPEDICKNMTYDSKVVKLYKKARNACSLDVIPLTHTQIKRPKILVQTYSLHKKVPARVFENIKKYAPDYDYQFFDDTQALEFIEQNYGEKVAKKFKALKVNAHKADLFRYCYLYKNGGVYLDIKTELIKPLDEVFTQDYLYTVFCTTQDVIYNAIIATPPLQPIFKELIKFMVNGDDNPAYHSNCKKFYDLLEERKQGKLELGVNAGNIYLMDEVCLQKDNVSIKHGSKDHIKYKYAYETMCYDGKDRYGLCCFIYDMGSPVFKARYADFPW